MIPKLFVFVLGAALAMTAHEPVRPNLDGFEYPPVARSARLGGAVQFLVNPDGIQLLSGHQLLVAAARSNLEKWAVPHASDTPLSVTYVFRPTGEIRIETVEVDRPIGNSFDRFFLRLLRRPVSRRIKEEICLPKDTPPIYKYETKNGLPGIEIEIGGGSTCAQPDVVAIAAFH